MNPRNRAQRAVRGAREGDAPNIKARRWFGDLYAMKDQWLTQLEWAACIGATLAAVWLHVLFLTHAGGLWRDEASGVYIATLPTFSDMLKMLTHDSFPVLFPTVLRFWSGLGMGSSDLGLRCLGFGMGLSVLGMLWLSARAFGLSMPLISLALLAANLTLVRWGDSLRAYGLACLLILLFLGAVWSLIRAPSLRRFVLAALAGILSVQCLYSNAFLLLGICAAAAIVCMRCKQDRLALIALAVGVPAAISLVPYFGPVSAAQRWWIVEKMGFSSVSVFHHLTRGLGSPMLWQGVVWLAVCLGAMWPALMSLRAPARRKRIGPEELPLLAATTIALSLFGFFFFLVLSKLPTQPWYWLPPMVLIALCAEAGLAPWLARYRVWRLVVMVVLVVVPLTAGIKLARFRKTNIDLIAAKLQAQAKPADLIVVYPWYCGITFNRYYKAATPWTTIPPLSDLNCHRYDLLKDVLATKAPLEPVLQRLAQTLGAGNRVWLVGELPTPEAGETQVPDLPPAPESVWGWFDVPYNYAWGRQTDNFLLLHGGRKETVPIRSHEPADEYEDLPLTVFGMGELLPGK